MNLKDFEWFSKYMRGEYRETYNSLGNIENHDLRHIATMLSLELEATKKELELETHNRILYEKALDIAVEDAEVHEIPEPEEGFLFYWVNKAEEEIENESKK